MGVASKLFISVSHRVILLTKCLSVMCIRLATLTRVERVLLLYIHYVFRTKSFRAWWYTENLDTCRLVTYILV